MKKIIGLLLAGIMVFAVTACGGDSQPAGGSSAVPGGQENAKVSLRLGSFPGDTMNFMQDFADSVIEKSNGDIEVEVINFLTMGSPADAVNNCKAGTLDMIIMSGNDYVGYAPCSAAIAVPMQIDNVEEAYKVELALQENGYFADWDGEILSILLTDMQYIALAKKEVKSADDFAGIIGRCQNANGIAVLQALGASVTTITTNEVYNALNTGVIDFSVSSPTNMLSSSYDEVVKYILDEPLYCDANCLIMNKDSFANLSADQQKILKDCGLQMQEDYQSWLVDAEKSAIEELKNKGVTFSSCPEDVLAKIKEASITCKEEYNANLQKAGVDTDAMNKVIEETLK